MSPAPRPLRPSLTAGPTFSRRHFLAGAAAGVATVVVASCTGTSGSSGSTTTTASDLAAGGATPPGGGAPALVIVELAGGNDGLSMLVPADGRYHDARPTIAVPAGEVLALDGTSEVGLHPALAPLLPLWAGGTMAAVRGIGFPDPDRSHFVSLDRWWRADQGPSAPGWLAPWLSSLPDDAGRLSGTAVLGRSPILGGGERQPTSLLDPASFRLEPALATGLRTMSAPGAGPTDLHEAARAALADATDALTEVGALTAAGQDGLESPDPFTSGLAFAAEVVGTATGPTVVVVSSGGFDTHSSQVATHDRLYADLAAGIAGFWERATTGAFADRVLMATTSEFGRRVGENASGGTDHGAAGVSLLFGPSVVPGLHGGTDLGDLLDGDLRPGIDPRVLQTACLDWLGADVDAALGRRWEGETLVRA